MTLCQNFDRDLLIFVSSSVRRCFHIFFSSSLVHGRLFLARISLCSSSVALISASSPGSKLLRRVLLALGGVVALSDKPDTRLLGLSISERPEKGTDKFGDSDTQLAVTFFGKSCVTKKQSRGCHCNRACLYTLPRLQ